MCPLWEAGTDSGGLPEGVEAGHLARHWLGEIEVAPEELLRTVQEPGEGAAQPRPQGESSEALRELLFQRGEHEGSPGLGGKDSSRTQHQTDLHGEEGRNAEMMEAEWP